MLVKILGAHNTESSSTSNMTLLVDSVMALDAGGLTHNLAFEDQMKLKAVLLTHHHYDHAKDVPGLAMNFFLKGKSLDLFTHQVAYDNLLKYYLDGEIYPQFQQRPEEKPTLRLHVMEPFKKTQVFDYEITALPVIHSIPAFGFLISDRTGKSLFYTGDTGLGLDQVWGQISPDVLFIEVTASNKWEEAVKNNGHLTPGLLKAELENFKAIKQYLPRVVCVHINPDFETEIKAEIAEVSSSLDAKIKLAHEGMTVEI